MRWEEAKSMATKGRWRLAMTIEPRRLARMAMAACLMLVACWQAVPGQAAEPPANAMIVVPSQLALQSDAPLLADLRERLASRVGEANVTLEILGDDRFPTSTMLHRWRETMAHRQPVGSEASDEYVVLMHDAAVRAYRGLAPPMKNARAVAYGVRDSALREWLKDNRIPHVALDAYAERSLHWALGARRDEAGPLALWYVDAARRDAIVASVRRQGATTSGGGATHAAFDTSSLSDTWLSLAGPDQAAVAQFAARRQQQGQPRQAFLSAPVTRDNLRRVQALAADGWQFWCYQREWLRHGCLGGIFPEPGAMASALESQLFSPVTTLNLGDGLFVSIPPSVLYSAREWIRGEARDDVSWLEVPESVIAQRHWTWLAFGLAAGALLIGGLLGWLARRRELRRQRRRLAMRNDQVTDLPGRFLLERRLQNFMEDAYAVSLYYLAFDSLRHLRAQFGVEYANVAAQCVAERLRGACGGVCYPARLSDDVFVVMASGAQDPMTTAQRYQDEFDIPIEVLGVPHRLEPRIGVAISPEHGKTPTALLQAAQDAADQVLASGGTEPQFFQLDMLKTAERRRVLAETLADALEEEAPFFELYLQPQYRLAKRELVGAEALIRWHHPTLGTISPGEFIPVAEASHQIVPLDEKVFDAMLEWLSHKVMWPKEGMANGRSLVWAINLSIRHFDDMRFTDWLLARCKEYGIAPQSIELEVTEHVATQDLGQVRQVMRTLRLHGFGLVLDDFGAGYTSLRFLKELPFTKVKLDKVYVDSIADDERSQLLVKGITDLARGLGLTVVAEGIENQEQLDILRGLGCPIGQGYLLGRPCPVDDFLTRLAGKRVATTASSSSR
ncbi:putative bifunctional diguanylate cyclase/phosphodiesterase [Chromohalobacter israelensis]